MSLDDRTRPVFGRPNLPLLMLQAREQVLNRFRPLLHAHGVTEQQWRILRVLVDRGPQEPRELVLACGLSSPSLTGILARMEAEGLVDRERLANDQRRVMVSTTPRSRALAREVAPRIDAAYAEIEARLGADFVGRLARTLDAMIDALGRATDAPGDDVPDIANRTVEPLPARSAASGGRLRRRRSD